MMMVSKFYQTLFASKFKCAIFIKDVEVQLPSALSVSEDSGVSQVCVSLLTPSPTQREVSVLVTTEEGSAVG